MAGKVVLLLWGAQTTQLLVQPPWTPPVLWDRVTLTCQGLGTAAATTWYKDGQRWRLQGPDRFVVTESGTYQCYRPGTGLSPPVSVLNAWLVLQVPAWALMEGDMVTLRCRGWQDKPVASVSFYCEEKQLQRFRDGTELSLSPLRLHHSGRNRCRGWVYSVLSRWKESAPVPVTVHKLFPVPVLEGPLKPTEGSPLNLSCLSTPSPLRPQAPLLHLFYRHGQLVGGPQGSPQLLLPAVGVSHSGNYSCQVRSERGAVRKSSARLRVTVRRVPLSGVSVSAQPPGGQVVLGDRLVLNCTVAAGTGPLSFSWHRGHPWALLGTGPHLELSHVGDNDSGRYQCRASNRDSVAESVPLNVTVLGEQDPQERGDPIHVPVANATISPGALAQPVRAGDPVTLRCSVQVGSAPVTFTWLRNGREVARGPLLELGDVHVGHSGTYQCVATNQLGQDGHRVFRALSPELALTVTPRGHWDTAVAVNIGRSLLFLVLLLGVIGGCHWWQRLAARKPQDSAPTGVPRPCPPSASTSDQRAAAGTLRGTAGPRCHLRECDVTLGGNWGSLGGIESPQRSLTALHSTPGPPHSPSQCRGLGTGPFCLFLDSKGSVWIKAEEMGLVCSALPAQLGKEEGPAQGAEQILVGFA
ncbi:Fc receptor-like protein 4 isoform X2 [Corvus moneduloides]|uniref:Fc receptor-like protein 4 isoform X2 n=1 Tax=Corvus moneduloides TaxID=1196302 RepID=UPI001363818D|nr:Fc receptor-like protein 4 isoform X2 [Corvus moneduloides]